MKFRTLGGAFLVVMGSFSGCSDEHEPHSQGSTQCDELGELCHEAGEIDAEAEECHDVGHIGNADTCRARYDECKALCTAILDGGVDGSGGNGGAGSG